MEDKEKSFEFEKKICFDRLELWENEAQNLFYSAEVLYEFAKINFLHIFSKNNKFTELFPEYLTERCLFNYRIQRMLWGYGLECLLKALILKKIKDDEKYDCITSDIIKQIKSHDLIKLATRAEITLTEPEIFYLNILIKCTEWAGKYPLPVRSEQMYEQRESLPSRELLYERYAKKYEQYLNGEIVRMEDESDIINSGINENEIEIYNKLKKKLLSRIKNGN